MAFQNSSQLVCLSHVHSDEVYALRLGKLLEPVGIAVTSVLAAESGRDAELHAESILSHCSTLIVLIGPRTRNSRWVDLEIALATKPRAENPSAALLGIILPEHPDYRMPYYEPDNIPVRLHDRVRWEYAIIRKWAEDRALLQTWLADAERRRRHFRPETNYATLQVLKSWSWDEDADTPRPALRKLWEQDQ